jgi:hypothetical protein
MKSRDKKTGDVLEGTHGSTRSASSWFGWSRWVTIIMFATDMANLVLVLRGCAGHLETAECDLARLGRSDPLCGDSPDVRLFRGWFKTLGRRSKRSACGGFKQVRPNIEP